MRASTKRERGRDNGGRHGARGGQQRLLPARAVRVPRGVLPAAARLPQVPRRQDYECHREVLPGTYVW